MSDNRELLAVAGAGLVGIGIFAGLYYWRRRGREAPPEERPPVAGELSSVEVVAVEGVAMGRSLAQEQAAEIARRGFASPAVSVRADQEFYVAWRITNTGGIRTTYYVITELRSPGLTYQRVSQDHTLDPGQSVGSTSVFMRSQFQVAAWEPGTYDVNVRLLEAGTNQLMDEVNLPRELTITAPAVAAGQLSGVQVVPV